MQFGVEWSHLIFWWPWAVFLLICWSVSLFWWESACHVGFSFCFFWTGNPLCVCFIHDFYNVLAMSVHNLLLKGPGVSRIPNSTLWLRGYLHSPHTWMRMSCNKHNQAVCGKKAFEDKRLVCRNRGWCPTAGVWLGSLCHKSVLIGYNLQRLNWFYYPEIKKTFPIFHLYLVTELQLKTSTVLAGIF